MWHSDGILSYVTKGGDCATTWRVEHEFFRPPKEHYFTESLLYHPEHIYYLTKKDPFFFLKVMVFLRFLPAIFKS